MTDDERRILIAHHAGLVAKWVSEPRMVQNDFLTFHAERCLALIKELAAGDASSAQS